MSSARPRHHQRRGTRTGESVSRDDNLTVALGDGAGGQGGDLVAGPSLAQEQPIPSTAERITDTEALIERLEGELAASRAVEERSRALRAEHALAAAEGSASAQEALAEASHAAALATLSSENLELAIGSARERLAGLEAAAEAERLDGVRAQALELACQRQRVGAELEAKLGELNEVFVRWRELGLDLLGLRHDERNRQLYLPHGLESVRAVANAIPDELRKALTIAPAWVHPHDRKPIADADPAAAFLRDAGELPPAAPDPYFERHAAMVAELGISSEPTPAPLQLVEPVPQLQPMKIGDVTPDGMRLVGKLSGGGGVWEPVNKGSRPPPEAA
jgi:hypothetical protein